MQKNDEIENNKKEKDMAEDMTMKKKSDSENEKVLKEERNKLDHSKKNEQEKNEGYYDVRKKRNYVDKIHRRKKGYKKSGKELHKTEFRTLEVGVLVVLTCVISLVVGGTLGIKFTGKSKSQKNIEVADAELQNFIDQYNYLIRNYYGELDSSELLNTAFKSIVDSLDDTYSGTIDENTSNNFDIELEGSYDGLGVEITNDQNLDIYIYSIIPNSPASQVDLQPGDRLITVNGTPVSGMSTTDFIKDIVKKSGAKEFIITYERNGEQKTVEIKKQSIVLQSVISKTYEEAGKKIGYLKVTIFAANTYDQFKDELQKLEEAGIDSLIIDLRDNSGGHLTSVKNMISLFLDSSHVIYQTQDSEKTTKVYSDGKETKRYPIVLIGNSASASASEVMIGALTEEYGAVLVGNQTFGKGTVQELHTLSNGEEYKFTTKKWLTPKGNWVHKNGIKPTIEASLGKEYQENPIEENDTQLRAALDYFKETK